MSVLNRIAYFQERRDEVPNQELARELAHVKDQLGIQEIAQIDLTGFKNLSGLVAQFHI